MKKINLKKKHLLFTATAGILLIAAACNSTANPYGQSTNSNPYTQNTQPQPGQSTPAPQTNLVVPSTPPAPTPKPVTPAPTPTPTPAPTPAPKTASVTIMNYGFTPQHLTVKVGTKVTWTNRDNVEHTVTGDNGGPASSPISQ